MSMLSCIPSQIASVSAALAFTLPVAANAQDREMAMDEAEAVHVSGGDADEGGFFHESSPGGFDLNPVDA